MCQQIPLALSSEHSRLQPFLCHFQSGSSHCHFSLGFLQEPRDFCPCSLDHYSLPALPSVVRHTAATIGLLKPNSDATPPLSRPATAPASLRGKAAGFTGGPHAPHDPALLSRCSVPSPPCSQQLQHPKPCFSLPGFATAFPLQKAPWLPSSFTSLLKCHLLSEAFPGRPIWNCDPTLGRS